MTKKRSAGDVAGLVWGGVRAGFEALAESNGLSPDEVVQRHHHGNTACTQSALPGIAYLGEVDEAIARPRLATPGNTYRRARWALRIGRRRCIRPNHPVAGT